jgi:hypothetical protein
MISVLQFPGLIKSDKENVFVCIVEYVRGNIEMLSFPGISFHGIDKILKLTNSDSFMNVVILNLCTIEIYIEITLQ